MFEETQLNPQPEPPGKPAGTVGDILASFFKNPAGGAGEVHAEEGVQMTAGFTMLAIGFGAFLVTILTLGTPGVGEAIGKMAVMYLFISAALLGMNAIGMAAGSAERSFGSAMMGTGACAMFYGIVIFLGINIGKGMISNSMFMIFFAVGIILGLFFMLGGVTNGIWANRFKTSPILAGWVSAFSISMALAIGIYLYMTIVEGAPGSFPIGRMFR